MSTHLSRLQAVLEWNIMLRVELRFGLNDYLIFILLLLILNFLSIHLINYGASIIIDFDLIRCTINVIAEII
jgi:hypothetical protein